ncbi:hypothetical protein D3C84_659310 [compost metagenome]
MHRRQRQCVRDFDHGIDHLGQERCFYPWPANAFDPRAVVKAQVGIAGLVVIKKHRALGIGAQHPGAMLAIANIAAQSGGGTARARAGNQPARLRVLFKTHLMKNRFGDVVVRPPVGGALGVGELVNEMPVVLPRQALGLGIDLGRIIDQMALATVESDLRDLLFRGGRGHHGNERQTQHPRKVRLGNGRRTAGGFDDRRPGLEPAITQRIQEQRARQSVLEAAGGVAGLVLEIQVNARKTRKWQRNQVGVGAALEVGFDDPDGFAGPLSVVAHGVVLIESGRSRP